MVKLTSSPVSSTPAWKRPNRQAPGGGGREEREKNERERQGKKKAREEKEVHMVSYAHNTEL